jgi:tetratricopeptide (TPR) repeat protein
MGKKLYAEAISQLEDEIKSGDAAANGVRFLMMGECYYMQAKYAESRPWFQKALDALPNDKNRITAQYRLASLCYRMGDTGDAIKKTDEFIREFPGDERSGRLLVMKMKVVAGTGTGAEQALDTMRRRLAAGGEYGAGVNLAADKVMADFYQSNGNEEKAVSGYQGIISNFRRAQSQYAQEKKPVPADMQETHDYAALRLGAINLKARRESEAVRWLQSVQYDPEMMQKARLTLAQIAYDAHDYRLAESYLLKDGYIDMLPPSDTRSDMYLLLGFCAKKSSTPTREQVIEYFGKVEKGSKAYFQAQMGMADTEVRWRKPDHAVLHYENALESPRYEAEALFNLGKIYLSEGNQEGDPAKKQELLAKAAERYDALMRRHPMTPFAREADEAIRTLVAKGFKIQHGASDEEVFKRWETVITNAPGSIEAARALLNIARMHQNSVLDEKTREFIKAPDFAACARTCNRLLDESVYTGRGMSQEQWDSIRSEALYYRGLCGVSSVGHQTDASTPSTISTVYLKDPDLQKAMADLTRARELVNPKEIEMLKNIEVLHVEGLFKSSSDEKRREAENRFAELVEKYGRDSRLQRLAMNLGKWHQEQGHYIVAADAYKGIADRAGAETPQDDIMNLLFLAGKLYSRAAHDVVGNREIRKYGIDIYAKEATEIPGLLETYKPFRKVVRLENADVEMTGEQAIQKVSDISKIPFVWSKSGTVGQYLKTRRLKFSKNPATVKELLLDILDLKTQDLSFDIGFLRDQPTLAPVAKDAAAADSDSVRVIEIHARGDWEKRFEPVSRPYGVWGSVHRSPSCMMFNVLKRAEDLTGARVLWAEGINSEDLLAVEYKAPPTLNPPAANPSIAQVLTTLLDAQGLAFRIVPRDVTAELYENAKDCFTEVMKIAPRSPQGEESLFLLALNYYRQEDYKRMKIAFEEYMRAFDGPGYARFHQACFWVGWVNERDRRFRDAAKYYQRAAEEYLTVYPVDTNEPPVSADVMHARLSYDTRYAFDEAVTGAITNMPFASRFVPFVRLNTDVDVRLDPAVADLQTPVRVGAFKNRKIFDIFWEALTEFSLTFRAENSDPETAEKSYYRLAYCLKQEDMNEEALGACETLLTRYPKTSRKTEAINLRLEIHKALKNYGDVLKDMELQRTLASTAEEAQRADYARGWVLMDLCRYTEAAELFKRALEGTIVPQERVAVLDGYARALMRGGKAKEALAQYEILIKEDTSLLRLLVEELMIWYLQRVVGTASGGALPKTASEVMKRYDGLDEQGRLGLDRLAMAKVTWVYYVTGLYDLLQRDVDRALDKFNAAANSPDDWLAAESILRAAEIDIAAGRLDRARESLEYLLFSTQSVEGEINALRLLAQTLRKLGDTRGAEERLDVLVRRFPESMPAMQVLKERADPAPNDAKESEEGVKRGAGKAVEPR